MTDTTPKATKCASGVSIVGHPTYDWPFDSAADEEAFKERGRQEAAARKAKKQAHDNAVLKERRKHNFIPIDTEEVKALREQGISDEVIAERLGVCARTIARKCGNRNPEPMQLTPAQRKSKQAKAKRMKKLGASQQTIAETVGVSQASVSYWYRNGMLDDEMERAA